eukprot:9174641-Alexandrium_andersonii.AAC.1
MERCDPGRQPDGAARLLPHEYIPIGTWPMFAPEQIIALRMSNCRACFPQLAHWYDELSQPTVQACKR